MAFCAALGRHFRELGLATTLLALTGLAACSDQGAGEAGASAVIATPASGAPAAAHPTPMQPNDTPTDPALAAALNTDAPHAVLALAQSSDPTQAHALAHWARAHWKSRNVDPMARVLAQLALGADLREDAVRHFSDGPLADDGTPAYTHAVALGYLVGALQSGLRATSGDEAAHRDLVLQLLRSAARGAGVAQPTAALPGPDATAGQRWVRFNIYPLLAPAQGAPSASADDLLEHAAVPVAATRLRANGEPDLEIGAGSAALGAFQRRLQAQRRASAP
ncbi:hypothetical protein FVQ98_09740 [Ottowia sp. GY511]|nr:hypothetical protein FVQ98_09740 [Ottowia sp. GY511]